MSLYFYPESDVTPLPRLLRVLVAGVLVVVIHLAQIDPLEVIQVV